MILNFLLNFDPNVKRRSIGTGETEALRTESGDALNFRRSSETLTAAIRMAAQAESVRAAAGPSETTQMLQIVKPRDRFIMRLHGAGPRTAQSCEESAATELR
jgi:hypothetical protein